MEEFFGLTRRNFDFGLLRLFWPLRLVRRRNRFGWLLR
jgi:hypothetical protein